MRAMNDPTPGQSAPTPANFSSRDLGFATLPPWALPEAATLMLAALHFVGALVCSVTVMWSSLNNLDEWVFVWGIAALLTALPLTVATAAVSHRIERVQSSYTSVKAWLWLPYAFGVTQLAHWLPACFFSPTLALASIEGSTNRRMEAALIGLFAWFAAALALGVAVASRRAIERRDLSSARLRPPLPALVPSSLVVAVAYGSALAMPTLLWVAALDDAWDRGRGALLLFGFWLFTGAAAILAGGLTGSWLLAVGPHAPGASIGARMRQIEVAGALFAAHWGLVFPMLLVPETGLGDDLRFSTLFCSFCAILIGVTLWSGARTARIRAALPAEPVMKRAANGA